MSDEGRGGGSELVSDLSLDLDLYLDRDPESCKILWIWIRPNDADPQNCLKHTFYLVIPVMNQPGEYILSLSFCR